MQLCTMTESEPERSQCSSSIPWKEMFKAASSPGSPSSRSPGLTVSRSSPSLDSVTRALQGHPIPRSEFSTPSRPLVPEVVSVAAVSTGNVDGHAKTRKNAEANEIGSIPNTENSVAPSSLKEHPDGAVIYASQQQQNFQLAVYIAMAHGALIFIVLVLYGIWRLLECYRTPIQWALLCSMPLREIHGTIVAFWETPLNKGLLGIVLAIPFALCKAIIGTTLDAKLTILHAFGRSRSKMGREVTFSTLIEWLVSFATFSLAYENLGTIAFALIPFAVILLYRTGTSFGLISIIGDVEVDAKPSLLSAESMECWDHAKNWIGFVFSPLTKTYRLIETRLTGTLVRNLHHVVAVFLMVMLIVGSVSSLILFSYKIGSEGKSVVVALKDHVQRSNYTERLRVKQWLEDNKIPEFFDTYATKAYDTISLQIDEYAAKYQMTELADVGKQYLVWLAQGQKRQDLANRPMPSHPVLDSVTNITQKLWEHDFKRAYTELYQGCIILLEHLNIPRDEMLDKAKEFGEQWLGVGKHVFTNSALLLSSLVNLIVSIIGTVLSGAPEFMSFCANALVFYSLLHYLVVSKSGGVMEQMLSMIPLSESTRKQCASVLDHAVSSVLLAAVKAAFFQASFTWLLFYVLRVHFLYMSTLIAFVSALLPIVPTWWSSILAGAELAIEGRYIQAVIIMAVHNGFMDYGVSAIQSGIPGHNAYLTGLSIAGGMALFPSAIEGAIMGPLLMTVAISLRNLYSEFVLSSTKKGE